MRTTIKKRPLTIQVNAELHSLFKKETKRRDIRMRSVIENAIRSWIASVQENDGEKK